MNRIKAGPKKVVNVKEEEVDERRMSSLSMLCTVAVLYLQELIIESWKFSGYFFSPILNQTGSY